MEAVALFDPITSSEPLKKAAKDLGFKVIAIYTRPLSVYESQFLQTIETLSQSCDLVLFTGDLETILQKIKTLNWTLKASISGHDSGTLLADQLAHALHLPSNQLQLSSARRDKVEMRGVLQANGFPCPAFAACNSRKELIEFAESHPFPLVIKTPQGAGTTHVYVCNSLQDVLDGYEKMQREEDFFGQTTTSAIIEEFIDGTEYIVNTFSDGKKSHVTDLWVYEKIDTEHFKNIYSSVISVPLRELSALQKTGLEITKAFGIEIGPAHLEIKDDPIRGPTLIELGARLVGARLPLLLRKYTNFDPYKLTIEVFTKGHAAIPEPIIFQKHLAVAFCPLFQTGIVTKILGLEKIKELASYEQYYLRLKEGDQLSPTTHLNTIPLTVALAHKDRNQLLSDIRAAQRLFQVELR